MNKDVNHDTDGGERPPTTNVDDGRYASVAIDRDETIIYDREIEEAWIQADTAKPLREYQ